MPWSEVVVPVTLVLMGGGMLTAFAQLISARSQLQKARQDDERLPAEVQSVWLGGAEKAVAALQVALDRAEKQITRLESALDKEREVSMIKDQRIVDLEHQLFQMRTQLNRLQTQADKLGTEINELKEEG